MGPLYVPSDRSIPNEPVQKMGCAPERRAPFTHIGGNSLCFSTTVQGRRAPNACGKAGAVAAARVKTR
jgi:hypothetical protein